jgi:hypothetical protein
MCSAQSSDITTAKRLKSNMQAWGAELRLSFSRYSMIRISTKNEPRRITITVDGQLAGEDVDAVEKCCAEATRPGRRVRLFLRAVSNIDMRGRELLDRLAAKGLELSASGVYSSYVVEEVRRHAGSEEPRKQKPWQNGT